VRILEQRTLADIIGGDGRPHAASDLGFARLENGYRPELLDAIHGLSVQLRQGRQPAQQRFLGLDHLRRVQDAIPQVRQLVHDPHRLARLSEVAGVELEPYPISTSRSGVNFYWPGQNPIEFHCDGPRLSNWCRFTSMAVSRAVARLCFVDLRTSGWPGCATKVA